VGWRARFATETFVPFFMKSGTKCGAKKCRGEEALFLTTEYTEAGKPYLKDTEKISVCSVWERSDLSVKFSGKKVGRGRQNFLVFTFHEK
jgi:hypothetical protein